MNASQSGAPPRGAGARARDMTCALLLVAACGGSSAPAPPPAPVANTAPAPPPPPGATCIPPGAPIIDTVLADGGLVACYAVRLEDSEVHDCWHFDLATAAWRFAEREPAHEAPHRIRSVTATAKSASVCAPDGSDCRTIPLSGIKLSPDDELDGATNSDRSIVAVWAGSGPVHVFDASGKRLATIQPWPTAMSGGKDPSVFREASVLGKTIEVRIADTPVSSAIRLFDARGKKIADVFGGQSMKDTGAALELGGNRYVYTTFDPRLLVLTDVATGKQLGSYPIPGEPGEADFLFRTPDGNVAGVIGTTAVVLDVAAGKVSSAVAPACAE